MSLGGLAPAGLRHGQHDRRRPRPARPGGRPNLFIKIPGPRRACPPSKRRSSPGVRVNVTLLFSREQYVAAAEAYLRGIERRIDDGLETRRRLRGLAVHQPLGRRGRRAKLPEAGQRPARHRHRQRTYKAYRELLARRVAGSASTTPAHARNVCCGRARVPRTPRPPTSCTSWLTAPLTVNTMPEGTLKAFAEHGQRGTSLPADGRQTARTCWRSSPRPASTSTRWPTRLQDERSESFVKSWDELMVVIASKSPLLKTRRQREEYDTSFNHIAGSAPAWKALEAHHQKVTGIASPQTVRR